MNHFINEQWMPLLGYTVFRGTMLLLLAIVLCHFARRIPTLRHRIGVLTFAGLMLLPLITLTVPNWTVAVLTRHNTVAQPTVAGPQPANASPTKATSSPLTAQSNSPAPVASTSLDISIAPLWAQFISRVLLVLWAIGAFCVLARIVFGLQAVRRLQTRQSQPINSGPLAERCAQLAHDLGIRRPVTLHLALDSAASVPMTWGWRSPKLLLPADATSWPPGQLQSVLLHELSHIRRGDWATQCLATVACALYWFHPLAWLANARLKADAERATDEQVISAGVKASDYCAHLLELARLATSGPQAYIRYGVPIARGASIENRLKALLAPRRPRRALSRLSTTIVTACFALAFILVAGQQFKLNADPPATQTTSSTSYTATVPGGGSVSLLGVSFHPSRGKAWWTTNGSPLPTETFITDGGATSPEPKHKRREFVVSLNGIPQSASWRWKTVPGTNWAGGSARFGNTPPANASRSRLIALSASIPQELSNFTLKIGIANAPWQTIAENTPQSNSSTSQAKYQVSFSKGTEDHGKATVTVSHTIFDQDVRLTAVDTAGHEHSATEDSSMGNDAFYQVTCSFQGLPLSQVRAFRVQIRPFHWVTFPNIVLAPRQ